jgi:hypothetical protein
MTVKNMTEAHAREHNRAQLGAIIASNYRLARAPSDQLLTHICERLVRDAEAGRLSHEDSMSLAAFAVSTVRNCI